MSDCQHDYRVNYPMTGSMWPYCTKCGKAAPGPKPLPPFVPVAELRALVEQWREQLHWLQDWLPDTARRMARMADELAALIARHEGGGK